LEQTHKIQYNPHKILLTRSYKIPYIEDETKKEALLFKKIDNNKKIYV
jgi:hypothetical protein